MVTGNLFQDIHTTTTATSLSGINSLLVSLSLFMYEAGCVKRSFSFCYNKTNCSYYYYYYVCKRSDMRRAEAERRRTMKEKNISLQAPLLLLRESLLYYDGSAVMFVMADGGRRGTFRLAWDIPCLPLIAFLMDIMILSFLLMMEINEMRGHLEREKKCSLCVRLPSILDLLGSLRLLSLSLTHLLFHFVLSFNPTPLCCCCPSWKYNTYLVRSSESFPHPFLTWTYSVEAYIESIIACSVPHIEVPGYGSCCKLKIRPCHSSRF